MSRLCFHQSLSYKVHSLQDPRLNHGYYHCALSGIYTEWWSLDSIIIYTDWSRFSRWILPSMADVLVWDL